MNIVKHWRLCLWCLEDQLCESRHFFLFTVTDVKWPLDWPWPVNTETSCTDPEWPPDGSAHLTQVSCLIVKYCMYFRNKLRSNDELVLTRVYLYDALNNTLIIIRLWSELSHSLSLICSSYTFDRRMIIIWFTSLVIVYCRIIYTGCYIKLFTYSWETLSMKY